MGDRFVDGASASQAGSAYDAVASLAIDRIRTEAILPGVALARVRRLAKTILVESAEK